MQNLGGKSKGARGHGKKALTKMSHKNVIFFIFDIYYAALKIVTYVLHWYASLVKIFIKIWVDQSSFELI